MKRITPTGLAKGVPSAAEPPVQRDFCLSDNKSLNRTSFREREVYHRFMEGKKQTVGVDGGLVVTRSRYAISTQ